MHSSRYRSGYRRWAELPALPSVTDRPYPPPALCSRGSGHVLNASARLPLRTSVRAVHHYMTVAFSRLACSSMIARRSD